LAPAQTRAIEATSHLTANISFQGDDHAGFAFLSPPLLLSFLAYLTGRHMVGL
jgi:hypothetical protein